MTPRPRRSPPCCALAEDRAEWKDITQGDEIVDPSVDWSRLGPKD
jgi:hypothetical protein